MSIMNSDSSELVPLLQRKQLQIPSRLVDKVESMYPLDGALSHIVSLLLDEFVKVHVMSAQDYAALAADEVHRMIKTGEWKE